MKRYSLFSNPANLSGFRVTVASSGRSVFVPPGCSILDVLLRAGIKVPFNCGDGKCGVCEVRVVRGTPDHRDSVLTEAEKAGNRSIIVCCSGSLSSELVLDL
ncbi:MAG: 2Fe-2S iron-sulfur cluster binding domain-containing protein [Pseudomonadales bacterium]|nr:2Fe-2S iron-sulfur cluster binding domain-containing protein [Pseudomonadales bacterium]